MSSCWHSTKLIDGSNLQTVVGVNPWAANRNAEDYGEDVDEFCPERWLKEGNFQPGSLFSVRKPGIYFWSIEATVY